MLFFGKFFCVIFISLSLSTVIHGQSMGYSQEETSSSFETRNYQFLKPFHVQQDKIDGCSLASTLMVVNALRLQNSAETKPWTQAQLRLYLQMGTSKMRAWYHKVKGKGRGVSRARLSSYLPALLKELYKDGEIQRVRDVQLRNRKSISLETFRDDLENVTHHQHKFMLLNYSAHWSPLGWYDEEDSSIRVLDVDAAESYKEEYSYGFRQGEEEFDVKSFFYGPMRTRGYIVVEMF